MIVIYREETGIASFSIDLGDVSVFFVCSYDMLFYDKELFNTFDMNDIISCEYFENICYLL